LSAAQGVQDQAAQATGVAFTVSCSCDGSVGDNFSAGIDSVRQIQVAPHVRERRRHGSNQPRIESAVR